MQGCYFDLILPEFNNKLRINGVTVIFFAENQKEHFGYFYVFSLAV